MKKARIFMFCNKCSKEIPDNMKFCGFCGADVSKNTNDNIDNSEKTISLDALINDIEALGFEEENDLVTVPLMVDDSDMLENDQVTVPLTIDDGDALENDQVTVPLTIDDGDGLATTKPKQESKAVKSDVSIPRPVKEHKKTEKKQKTEKNSKAKIFIIIAIVLAGILAIIGIVALCSSIFSPVMNEEEPVDQLVELNEFPEEDIIESYKEPLPETTTDTVDNNHDDTVPSTNYNTNKNYGGTNNTTKPSNGTRPQNTTEYDDTPATTSMSDLFDGETHTFPGINDFVGPGGEPPVLDYVG